MARIGLCKAFGAPTRRDVVTRPSDEILLRLNRHEFNKVQQGLRALAEVTKRRMNKLTQDDVRRKSYGQDIYDINCLLRKCRDQFNGE